MSLPSAPIAEPVPQSANRRKHARSKPEQLVYIDMGGNNGGFLLDVSEVGACFQWFPGIMPLRGGEWVQAKFKLPGTNISIESQSQFVRHGDSENGGGLKLLNLPAEVQLQIRKWVARQEHAEAAISGDPGALPEPSGPITGTDGWVSSLAAEPREPSAEVPPVGGALPLFWIKRWLKERRWSLARIISERREPVGVAVESATAKPELPTSTALTSLSPTKSQTKEDTHATGRPAVLTSEPARPATSGAAYESVKKVREAVLQSMAARQQSQSKGSLRELFAVGLVVGCVALAAIGGGLVATGRLRLNTSSPAPSAGSDGRRSTVEMPAANSAEAPVRQQPKETGISVPSAPTPSRQAAAIGQLSVTVTVRPSPSRPADPSSAVQVAANQPLAETHPGITVEKLRAPVRRTAATFASNEPPSVLTPQGAENVLGGMLSAASGPNAPAPPGANPAANSPAYPGGQLEAPKLTYSPPPLYPTMARVQNVQGVVVIDALVDATGKVTEMKVVSGPMSLRQAATEAVSKWKYQPARLNGQPIAMHTNLNISFTSAQVP